jgi:hypothetical protein
VTAVCRNPFRLGKGPTSVPFAFRTTSIGNGSYNGGDYKLHDSDKVLKLFWERGIEPTVNAIMDDAARGKRAVEAH